MRELSVVVADSGDIAAVHAHRPQDATTNPSLILKEVESGRSPELIRKARAEAANGGATLCDRLIVAFGCEILAGIEGRVSTEVDARLSFDSDATVHKAQEIIALYRAAGIDPARVLIKIASTWEGLAAARRLEAEGIHCNMTLIFALPQAAVAAEAGATLISPFVGRILDWYKNSEGRDAYPVDEDPGVRSVRSIYQYIHSRGLATEVMGASFRNVEQILGLAGCDLLTIAPGLLDELEQRNTPVEVSIDRIAQQDLVEHCDTSEPGFRWAMNSSAMASDLLADGIRRFAADQQKLEALLG